MRVWTLKRAAEGPVRQGYPWVFSNQLAHSPKGTEPGELVELRDFAGDFVARGYGHPGSLISFRALSLDPDERDAGSTDFFLRRLERAWALRLALGLGSQSHRLCFAEADGLPGLVVDRYLLAGDSAQVLVVESSTAGMDRALPAVLEALERLVSAGVARQAGLPDWERTGVLIDQGSSVRQLEDLLLLPRAWHKPWPLEDAAILAAPALEGEPLAFHVDLLEGQKTGFFLDHAFNLERMERLVLALARRPGRPAWAPLRVLDLFCYVGQWGARLSAALSRAGVPCEVTAVDSSQKALELAHRNITAHGGQVTTLRLDVVENLAGLQGGPWDVVICDPPALVRRRKDLPKAARAYQKVHREALRRVAPGGVIAACSCSGLLEEDAFRALLGHAAFQARRAVRWVARGGQGPDHPLLAMFPEGRYLKCWMGVVD
jgi:23S rRNA (cytosine1962-C5)-methyltransferase